MSFRLFGGVKESKAHPSMGRSFGQGTKEDTTDDKKVGGHPANVAIPQ